MIRLPVCFLLLILSCFSYAVEIKPELLDVELSQGVRWDGKKLNFDIQPGAESGIYYAQFRINMKEAASKYLVGKLRVETENFKCGNDKKAGVQMKISYPADDNSHERLGGGSLKPDANAVAVMDYGIGLDPHAEYCTVRLSVVNSSGKISVDMSEFGFDVLFARSAEPWTCEYSQAVLERQRHRGVMSPIVNQDNEEHFRTLQEWNVNLLRLQLNTSDAWARNNPEKYKDFINEKIEKTIPRVLELAQKYGIKVIIDLHTVPGSAIMKDDSDGIYGSAESVNEFIAIWKRIAAKFKGHPALYGYDLINEPKQTRKAAFNYMEIQAKAASAIREIDPETPIYVESNIMSSPLTFCYLEPLRLKNIIYQIHFYEPFDYTHYFIASKSELESGKVKARSFPGEYYGTYWSEDLVQLRKKLAYVREFEQRYGAKIYVGEFSVPAYAPGADRYLASAIKIFEDYSWDWTYHAFREAKIWDLDYVGTANDDLKYQPDNSRRKLLLDAFKLNRRGN